MQIAVQMMVRGRIGVMSNSSSQNRAQHCMMVGMACDTHEEAGVTDRGIRGLLSRYNMAEYCVGSVKFMIQLIILGQHIYCG